MQIVGSLRMLKIITAKLFSLSLLTFFLSLLAAHGIYSDSAHGVIYTSVWGFPSLQVQRFVPGEVLIRFKVGTPAIQVANLIQRYGLRQISSSPYSGLQRVAAVANINGDLLQILRQEPGVAYAEANFFRRAEEVIPNDPLFIYQWHLKINDLPLAWDLSTGQGVTVAVLDSGVAYENYGKFALAPDLAGTIFLPGWDFINNDAHPNDDNRHGTHITGIIAQSTNNLIGGAGIAFQCNIMPVKVLDATGSGDVSTIVDGIYYAINNGAQIINLSFGSVADPSASEEEAINYAVEHGVLVVCSAGNEVTNQPHYPSSYPNSLSVTSTRLDNQFAASYSNYGPDVDLAAPGGDLSLDQDGNGEPDGIYQQTHNGSNFKDFDFYYAEGTSSSCAYVSGVAALVLARGRGKISAVQVRDILESTAIDLGLPGWDEQYGWGVINPYAAVLAVDALLNPQAAASQGYLLPFSPSLITQSLLLGSQLPYYYGLNNPASSVIKALTINNSSGYDLLSGIIGNTLSLTRNNASNNNLFVAGQNILPTGVSSVDVLFNPFSQWRSSTTATSGAVLLTGGSYGNFFPSLLASSLLVPWLW